MTTKHRFQPRLTALLVSIAVFSATLAPPSYAQVVNGSSLYYRMGGGSPAGRAPHKSQIAIKLGLAASLKVNYSCGKFDIGASWSSVINGLSNLGSQITGAVQAGIAALPLYILQRAQPGLYQMFQTYSVKADLLVSSALKTCEEMEAMIKSGKNPYQDWVNLAQGETWADLSQAAGNIVQAKVDIQTNEAGQKSGMSWVFGTKAGGVGQPPLRPVRDLSVAGYNATLNKPTTSPSTTNYLTSPTASVIEKNSRLVQSFNTPDALAEFTAAVLGDQQISLCSGNANCPPPTTATTATGLGPRYEAELNTVGPILDTLASAGSGETYADLRSMASQGMSITPQLLDSVRRLPPEIKGVAVSRLSQEMAMHRVIDKALVARNVLLTSLSLPEVIAAGEVTKGIQVKIDRLSHYIEDMMFEMKVRREMTSETAMAIFDDRMLTESQAARQTPPRRAETKPLESGHVVP